MGGVGALLLVPEPITFAIGLILGSLFGFAGRGLDEMKRDAISGLMNDLKAALNQIDLGLKNWCDLSAREIHEATLESFDRNLTKVARYLPQPPPSRRALPRGEGPVQ